MCVYNNKGSLVGCWTPTIEWPGKTSQFHVLHSERCLETPWASGDSNLSREDVVKIQSWAFWALSRTSNKLQTSRVILSVYSIRILGVIEAGQTITWQLAAAHICVSMGRDLSRQLFTTVCRLVVEIGCVWPSSSAVKTVFCFSIGYYRELRGIAVS